MDLIIQPAKREDLNEIVNLLSDNNLPTIDIKENTVQLFVGLLNNKIIGIIGLEKYNGVGLLRSLAIKDTFKNQKFGERLVKQLLDFCSREKIEELYLLTTTAEKYFEKFGFQKTERFKIPETIKQTREFKDICPISAVVMCKEINRDQNNEDKISPAHNTQYSQWRGKW